MVPTNRMVNAHVEATTLGHLVDRQAAATPEREALVFPDARLTYAQLAERSDAFARALAGLGVSAGDKVGILLANRVDAIATAYPHVERLKPAHAAKAHLVGNPVRDVVIEIGRAPYPAPVGDAPIVLLVTGGSQGATILSTVVPEAIARLDAGLRARLDIVQQCRPEDIEAVRARYAALGLIPRLETYLTDLPAELARAHLVIGRAGASTIAELTVAGRPAILVPLPSAMDDHQTANAREMTESGGARTIVQADFTPENVARALTDWLGDPDALIAAATHAKACGRPRATADLADLVESLGRPPVMDAIGDRERGAVVGAPAMGTN